MTQIYLYTEYNNYIYIHYKYDEILTLYVYRKLITACYYNIYLYVIVFRYCHTLTPATGCVKHTNYRRLFT